MKSIRFPPSADGLAMQDSGFGIQDSGERMKSICFPPSADGLAMQDSGERMKSICFPPSADGLAMQDSGFGIQDSGFRGENEEHLLSAFCGRSGHAGFPPSGKLSVSHISRDAAVPPLSSAPFARRKGRKWVFALSQGERA